MAVDELGRAHDLTSIQYLHPEDQVFEDMLTGFRNQQLSRNLHQDTIAARERIVRRFLESTNEYPWAWTPEYVDEFFGDLRAERHLARSTIRGYQNGLGSFCGYLSSAEYGWDVVCDHYFGAAPVQVCFRWNTASHAQQAEARPDKRAFTRRELQDFFDRADEEVQRIAKIRRKGWLPAFRDAVIFKTAYGWGLRNFEVRHLQTVDFSRNPHAKEFGKFGVMNVRWGKAMAGSPPKRRSVLTVFDWAPGIVEEWIKEYLPHMGGGVDLFISERGAVISESVLHRRFRGYCKDLNLSPGLDFHSLRRSYVTHLIESGIDALFVQQQAGHEHASTTALYTCVSSDFRTRTLRSALDSTLKQALNLGTEEDT